MDSSNLGPIQSTSQLKKGQRGNILYTHKSLGPRNFLLVLSPNKVVKFQPNKVKALSKVNFWVPSPLCFIPTNPIVEGSTLMGPMKFQLSIDQIKSSTHELNKICTCRLNQAWYCRPNQTQYSLAKLSPVLMGQNMPSPIG